MHRFHCPSQNISADKVIISDKPQVHHLRNVLRLKVNDKVIVFDEQGNEYQVVIERFSPQSIIAKLRNRHKFIPSQKAKLVVACAIPKKSKMDEIVDKLTQLGVEKIIPLKTERLILKLDRHKEALRQERWQRIALNASLQSQRKTLPAIEPITDIKEVLSKAQDFDLKLIPTLVGERKALKDIFAHSHPKSILVLIGPEGDFTPAEVDLAKRAGFIPISLGSLVLRVETAAIAVVSFIRLYENS